MTAQDEIETALRILPEGTQLTDETPNYLCFAFPGSLGITVYDMQTLRDHGTPVVFASNGSVVLERRA